MILGSARDKLGIQTEGLNYSKLPDRMYSVNFKSSTKFPYILSQYSEQFVKNPSYQAGEFSTSKNDEENPGKACFSEYNCFCLFTWRFTERVK